MKLNEQLDRVVKREKSYGNASKNWKSTFRTKWSSGLVT